MCKTRKFFETPLASTKDITYSRSQQNHGIKRSHRDKKYRCESDEIEEEEEKRKKTN